MTETARYKELFEEFCEWSPELAPKVAYYRPWGGASIAIWLKNGFIYKVKRYAPNKFVMQMMTEDDVNKKFGLNNK